MFTTKLRSYLAAINAATGCRVQCERAFQPRMCSWDSVWRSRRFSLCGDPCQLAREPTVRATSVESALESLENALEWMVCRAAGVRPERSAHETEAVDPGGPWSRSGVYRHARRPMVARRSIRPDADLLVHVTELQFVIRTSLYFDRDDDGATKMVSWLTAPQARQGGGPSARQPRYHIRLQGAPRAAATSPGSTTACPAARRSLSEN